jgi:hypothetical protein
MSLYPKSALSRWLAKVILLGLLMMVLWWGVAADVYLNALRPVADVTLPFMFPRGVRAIQPYVEGGWVVETGLHVAVGKATGEFLLPLNKDRYLYRAVMGMPVLWALILASSRQFTGRKLVAGTAILSVLCLLGIAALIWGSLAKALNPDEVPLTIMSFTARVKLVDGDPYSHWTVFIASALAFMQSYTLPIIIPILVWVTLCLDDIKDVMSRQLKRSKIL